MKKNILVFPAGSEIASEIYNALKYSKFVTIFGGTSVDDHSRYIFKRLITNFPKIDNAGFLDYLNQVIEKYHIDCVYPAHDSVSVVLCKNSNKIKAQVIIANQETTMTCRSKKRTYQMFHNYPFTPKVYDCLNQSISFPIFAKPDVGEGSKGIKIIDNLDAAKKELNSNCNIIFCEYLPGEEYTVDCFTDKYGKLLAVKPRTRERIRNGIAVKSRSIECDNNIYKIASTINKELSFKGAWFFQLKKDQKNEYKLLEISPRIPGTMGLSRNIGINFVLLTLFVFWGQDVSITENDYSISVDRALNSCYEIKIKYDHIYVDYDDCLIVNNLVNEDLIRYLYQALNKGKSIHLLSKHSANILVDLEKHRISSNIFKDIKIIDKGDEKHKYIKEKKSIFIDDSYAERKKIHDILNIPVFDLDMVESLYDCKK